MTTKTKLGLTIGLLATALLAACGGGGGGTSTTLPAKSTGGSGSGTGAQATATGPRLTFTFTRKAKPAKSTAAATGRRTAGVARRSAAAKRSPKYFSYDALGFQITVTSGTSTQTLYVDAESVNVCTADANDVYTCSIPLPTLGATETISALELDQEPIGGSATGYGTSFPSNSDILAVGNTTATLTAGNNTVIPLSFNPVATYLADECGSYSITYNQNIAVDTDYADNGVFGRIVVTAGVAGSTAATFDPDDASEEIIEPLGGTPSSAPVGQPFVDVNGSPEPITFTSNDAQIGLAVFPGGYAYPSPLPSPAYASTASVASSSAVYPSEDCGTMLVAFNYTGGPTPTASSPPLIGTVTVSNNLSATPPTFSGPPTGGTITTYAHTFTYTVDPIWATPTTVTLTAGSSTTATVTGYDYGLAERNNCCGNPMYAAAPPTAGNSPSRSSSCYDSDGNAIASISLGSFAYGTSAQPVTITPGTLPGAVADTCQFVLVDDRTSVITTPITVTVNPS